MGNERKDALMTAIFRVGVTICFMATQYGWASAQDAVDSQAPVIARSALRVDLPVTLEPAETSSDEDRLDLEKGPSADWIWRQKTARDGERVTFTKKITLEATKAAQLVATCDNHFSLFVNGKPVAQGDDWSVGVRADIQAHLKVGINELKAVCINEGTGLGAFICKIALQGADENIRYVVTDEGWKCNSKDDPERLASVFVHGPHGMAPWGKPLSKEMTGTLVGAVPPNVFQLLPGFQVEQLYTVPRDRQGSWVCIVFDDQGRLIASDQGNKGLFRITPAGHDGAEETRVEKLNVPMSSAHGMLFAFGSLYVSANGGPGSGLYRLRDTNDDGQFDDVKKLKDIRGGGEHGPHSLRLSPDGKSIVLIAGNHTDLPAGLDRSRIPTNWGEDLLLPRQWDARGHAAGKLAPGGWIAQTDPEGMEWELLSMGYRNPFDFAFNADGELFAYDADMEWDYGTPWYRPTRVVHASSGSEFGWRSGTGKWPVHYPDSLPPAVDIGPGSPVGVAFGYGTAFPQKYQQALYCLDWTFGTIYAVHFTPQGASYTAVKEEFLSRTPLPLTDVAVGPDGAMYFTTGGRGAQSALFRVSYVGDAVTREVNSADKKFQAVRELRHMLERHHHIEAPASIIPVALKNLAHQDRYIRYAARIALEFQPVEQWLPDVLTSTNAARTIQGMVAVARQGRAGDQDLLGASLTKLSSLNLNQLDHVQQRDLIRAYSLLFIRLGQGPSEHRNRVMDQVEPLYPSGDAMLDRELCNLLVHLNSAKVAGKTLELMKLDDPSASQQVTDLLSRNGGYGRTIANSINSRPEIQKLHYAFALRNLRYGWTLQQRRDYMDWFVQARTRSGGASYVGFLDNIQKEAVANMSDSEREALADSTLRPPPAVETLPKPKGPGSPWTVAEILKWTNEGIRGRDFQQGKMMFAAAKCGTCHRFDGSGGATGPDLSNVAGRFSPRDLVEAMVLPSKVISDQYRAMNIFTTDGKVLSGRVTAETEQSITLSVHAEDPTQLITISRKEIEEIQPAKLSLMPEKLLHTLNREEVLDLIAYMLSRGDPQAGVFRSQ